LIIAFIHAKEHSDRLRNKNIKILGDKPLFCHALLNAKNANLVDRVVVDSDSDEILNIAIEHGVEAFKRPSAFATNKTTGDDLAYYEAIRYESDIMLQVVPTSPFITSQTIDIAIDLLLQCKEFNTVVGVRKEKLYKWENSKPIYGDKIPNSFDLADTIFETTGLYVNRTDSVLKLKKRIDVESSYLLKLSKIEAIDINTQEDFNFAQTIWNGLNKK